MSIPKQKQNSNKQWNLKKKSCFIVRPLYDVNSEKSQFVYLHKHIGIVKKKLRVISRSC